MLTKFLSNIHQPLVMWFVIASASILAIEKYGLPIFDRVLYEWENCMSDEVLAKNDRMQAAISELTHLSIRQQRLFDEAFMPSPDGIFDHKETLFSQHKRMIELRAELPALIRSKEPDEWSIEYSRIEKIIQALAAEGKEHEQLFKEAVASITANLGKTIPELNADDRPNRMYRRQFMRRYATTSYPPGDDLYSLNLRYAKTDCRERTFD